MAYNGNQNPFENPSGRPRKSKDERRQSFRVRRRKWLYEWRNGGTNMTVILIALCVFFWLIAEILYFTNRPALAVYESAFVLRSDQSLAHPWTLLSVLFMHSIDISHIFFNMVSLYLAGLSLEKMLGHWEFLALYLVSGLGASVVFLLSALASGPSSAVASMIGASGAIFGLFGAMVVTALKSPGRQNAWSMVVFLGLILVVPMLFGSGVAWQAHLGGFAVGALLSWLMTDGVPSLRGKSIGFRMGLYGGGMALLLLAIWLVRVLTI